MEVPRSTCPYPSWMRSADDSWLPYNHSDMEMAREEVKKLISEHGCHEHLILNYDQVWRNAWSRLLRLCCVTKTGPWGCASVLGQFGSTTSLELGPGASNRWTSKSKQLGTLPETVYTWMFPKIGVPQNGWWKSWKTLLKWMIWGFSHYFWKHPPENGWLEYYDPFLVGPGRPIFKGKLAVSFREGRWCFFCGWLVMGESWAGHKFEEFRGHCGSGMYVCIYTIHPGSPSGPLKR